jgi:putative transposase
MNMQRSYKFRLYPSKQQEQKLSEAVGLCRTLYNHFLEQIKELGKIPPRSQLQSQLPKLKSENKALSGVHSKVLQMVLYQFYSNLKALGRLKKKGRKTGRLRFKKQHQFKSIIYNQSGFALRNKLFLSKIGEIPVKKHRHICGKIRQIIIKRQPSGKWFAILSCDTPPTTLATTNRAVGLDLGLKNYIADSNGSFTAHPHCLTKSEKKLTRHQRWLSRKGKKSENRARQRLKVAILYEKIENQRNDFLHKLSRQYVTSFDMIAVEALEVKELKEKSYTSKSISDASWAKFLHMLAYKAESAGRLLVKVDPTNTTKECSQCGCIVNKPLSQRVHRCPNCKIVLDRDFNAAKNILKRAYANLGQELPEVTPVGDAQKESPSMKQEADTFRWR